MDRQRQRVGDAEQCDDHCQAQQGVHQREDDVDVAVLLGDERFGGQHLGGRIGGSGTVDGLDVVGIDVDP